MTDENESQHSGQGQTSEGQDKSEAPAQEILRDPDLGQNIDISG